LSTDFTDDDCLMHSSRLTVPITFVSYVYRAESNAPHEANFLKLDCSKLKATFGWQPRWHMNECMDMVCRFSKIWISGGNIPNEMDKEIKEFLTNY
jgi:hypothetical protein